MNIRKTRTYFLWSRTIKLILVYLEAEVKKCMKGYYLVKVRPLTNGEIQNIRGMNISYLEENYDSTCYKFFKDHVSVETVPLFRYVRRVRLMEYNEMENFYAVYVEPIYKFNRSMGEEFAREIHFSNSQGKVFGGFAAFPFAFFNARYKDVLKSIGISRFEYDSNETVLFMSTVE